MAKRDLRQELKNGGGGQLPPPWDPKPGDVLVGVIERYATMRTKRGDQVRVAVIRVEDEESELTTERLSVWLSRTALRGRFEEHNPQVGDRVAIQYNGERSSAAGNRYHDYGLAVEHVTPQAFGDAARAEPGLGAPDEPGHESDQHQYDADDPGVTDDEIPF